MPMKTALFIEDNIKDAVLVIPPLVEAGYDVTIATNMEHAETYTNHRNFDLYVVDNNFPLTPSGKNIMENAGLAFCRKIMVQKIGAHCVLISRSEEAEQECINMGVKFFSKNSFNPEEFWLFLKLLEEKK